MIDEYIAFLTKKISNLKFKRNLNYPSPVPNLERISNKAKKKNDRIKFKCYNSRMTGHFLKCRKPKNEKKANYNIYVD